MTEADEHQELGSRLREQRKFRRLSLTDVAQHAEISTGYLSMLERGLSSASISVLRRLTSALGISISQLFDLDSTLEPEPLRREDRPKLDSDPGAIKYLISRPPLKAFEVYSVEFEEGASTGAEDYTHDDSQELLVVNHGEIEVLLAGRAHRLQVGDSIEYRSSMPHKVSNAYPGMSYITWVISPPTD